MGSPGTAQVTLEYEPDAVTIDVTDDGAGAAASAPPDPGHGLAGMRERAGILGGELTAGPGQGPDTRSRPGCRSATRGTDMDQTGCRAIITVLIADDQDLVREGLRMLLVAEPDITVVAEAGTGSEAIGQARRLDPDVVLMDIRMPDMDGIEAARQLTTGGSGRVGEIVRSDDLLQ